MAAHPSTKPAVRARPAWTTFAIAVATALGAVLRLAAPGRFPPGFNQDEAVNAWNAWCLLRTGHDMTGAAWPLFHAHAIGDERTTLFFYLLMPVQALFGLSVWSTRLPNALLGIACVPLAAVVARRLAGPRAAVIAALLAAIEPWHVFLSRWGIEGGATPFLALAPLALLARAGLLVPREDEAPRPAWALAAGFAAGIGCYGYWPVRLWMPATLALLALAAGPGAWRRLRERAFGGAVAAFAGGFAVTFGPLAWRHLTDPLIAHRADMTRLWAPGAPLAEIARLVASRWALHFAPGFLFVRGDSYELLQPAAGGATFAFLAPLMLAGIAFAVAAWRTPAARVLLVLVAAYPLGDLLAAYDGVHMLRSSVGAPALVLLGAYGAERLLEQLGRRGVAPLRAGALVLVAVAALSAARTYRAAFGEYNRRSDLWHSFQCELLDAAAWLRPHLAPGDQVVCTVKGFQEPWAVLLVALKHEPRAWFTEPRERRVIGGWDVYDRIGDWWFLYDPARVQRSVFAADTHLPSRRTWMILRPRDAAGVTPSFVVRDPQGLECLWVCEVRP